MKSGLMILVSLLVVLAIAQAQQDTPLYRVTALGTLGGASSEAFGTNNKGWVTGVSNMQGNHPNTPSFGEKAR